MFFRVQVYVIGTNNKQQWQSIYLNFSLFTSAQLFLYYHICHLTVLLIKFSLRTAKT